MNADTDPAPNQAESAVERTRHDMAVGSHFLRVGSHRAGRAVAGPGSALSEKLGESHRLGAGLRWPGRAEAEDNALVGKHLRRNDGGRWIALSQSRSERR
jgi:hypothetical protein